MAKPLPKHLQTEDMKLFQVVLNNHLVLIDLRNKNITGKAAENALVNADITVNKIWFLMMISRHLLLRAYVRYSCCYYTWHEEKQMEAIVDLIDAVIKDPENEPSLNKIRKRYIS